MDSNAGDTLLPHAEPADGRPQRFSIGEWTVWKVEERTIDNFTPAFLFPAWADLPPVQAGQPPAWADPAATVNGGEFLRLSIHTWVLQSPTQLVILDTGIGNSRERPGKAIFHQLATPYLQRLQQSGVAPEAVDLVVNTHLHTDHVGWNTHWVDGQWRPLFSRARYRFPAPELQHVQHHTGHLAQIYRDSVEPVVRAGLHETIPFERTQIAPGLTMVPTPGHTAGHMSLWLESEGEAGFFSGDVMHHPLQVARPELNSVFCEDPAQAAATRLRVLGEVAERRAIYFSSHFPASSAGRVEVHGAGYRWRPL